MGVRHFVNKAAIELHYEKSRTISHCFFNYPREVYLLMRVTANLAVDQAARSA